MIHEQAGEMYHEAFSKPLDFPLNRGLFVDTSAYVTLKSFP